MRRTTALAVSICGTLALVAGPAAAAEARYRAEMSADQQVPTPGPPGGKGAADITIDQSAGQLCYRLAYEGIGEPNGGHIHRGGEGMAGPVVADFDMATNGDEGCVSVAGPVLSSIAADPAGHYVNLHTRDYPNGAIRGQLAPA